MKTKRRRLKYLILHEPKYTFAFGTLIGMILAVIFHIIQTHPPFLASVWPAIVQSENSNQLNYDNGPYDFAYEKWLFSNQLNSCLVDPDEMRYTNHSNLPSLRCGTLSSEANMSSFVRDSDQFDPRSEAKFLRENIDVTCLIMSKEIIKSTAIRDTWGSHCNYLRFISHKKLEMRDEARKLNHSSILTENPAKIELLNSGSEFSLLCKGLRRIWNTRRNKIQWILIASEETFALPENLRYFVAPLNSKSEHYLGHAMKFWNVIYNWADAGYVLSAGTFSRLMEKFPNDESCEKGGQHWKNSDWYLGKHLAQMNITPVDTRDHIGRSRFIGHSLKKLLFPGGVSLFERYWRDSLYLSPDGPHCCSNFAITFHLTTSVTRVFQFYYLYYHLRPFSGGGQFGNQMAPQPKRPVKPPALTLDEQLKEQAMDKMFLSKLLGKS